MKAREGGQTELQKQKTKVISGNSVLLYPKPLAQFLYRRNRPFTCLQTNRVLVLEQLEHTYIRVRLYSSPRSDSIASNGRALEQWSSTPWHNRSCRRHTNQLVASNAKKDGTGGTREHLPRYMYATQIALPSTSCLFRKPTNHSHSVGSHATIIADEAVSLILPPHRAVQPNKHAASNASEPTPHDRVPLASQNDPITLLYYLAISAIAK